MFNDVIEKNDRINIAYGDRANAEVQAGDFSAALKDCGKLLEISPSNGKAFYNMGTAHSGLKLYRNAVDDFSRSIALGYNVASVDHNRGTAYYHLGAVDSAVSDYHVAELRDKQFADAPFSIGFVMLHDRKDAATALRYFDTALSVNPGHAEALYQKACAENDLRFYGMAMADLAAVISRQPSMQNDSLVARINTSVNDINAAISKIGDQLARAPGSKYLYEQRSRLFMMLGDSTRSMLDLKAAALPAEKRFGRPRRDVVLPQYLQDELGLKEGSCLSIYREKDRVVILPITEEFIRSLRGSLKGDFSLAEDREREHRIEKER